LFKGFYEEISLPANLKARLAIGRQYTE